MQCSTGGVLRPGRCRQPQQPFAAPDTHDADAQRVPTIDDPEGRVDQFAQKGLAKLRNDPPEIRVVGEDVHALEDLGDESVTNLRHPFCGVPCLDAPKSLSADSAKLTLATVMALCQAESGLGLGEGDLAAGVQVG